jgi:hypothetical protein
MIKNAGWMFLISLGVFFAYYGIFDFLLELVEVEIYAVLFSYIIYTGTSAGFCFGLSTRIARNRDKKKEIFVDWLIAQFIVCMFAIFSVAVYQW